MQSEEAMKGDRKIIFQTASGSSEKDSNLMFIPQNDLKDVLQGNCQNTHILLNLVVASKNDLKNLLKDKYNKKQILLKEIRESNNAIVQHFQESVTHAFKEIDNLLKEVKRYKKENNEKNDNVEFLHKKVSNDQQEIKNMMNIVMNCSNERIPGENYQTESLADSESYKGEK